MSLFNNWINFKIFFCFFAPQKSNVAVKFFTTNIVLFSTNKIVSVPNKSRFRITFNICFVNVKNFGIYSEKHLDL